MGVTLVFALLLSQLAPASQDVSAVELRLPPGTDEALARDASTLVGVRKGQPLSQRVVRRSIERLMETGKISDVVVRLVDEGSQLTVIFEVSPRRVLGEVYAEKTKALKETEVVALSRLAAGAEYYPERLDQALELIREGYRRRGYPEVKVTSEVSDGEEGVNVGFNIDEGPATLMRKLLFEGDPGLAEPRAAALIGLELNEVLDLERADKGVTALKESLRAEGFFRARVDAAREGPDGTLVIPVTAGPKFSFAFTGNRAFAAPALDSMLGFDGGEPLETQVQERLAQRLQHFYLYRGFHDVRVRVREEKSGPRTAVVRFVIDEGAPVVVREVALDGRRTVDESELLQVLKDVMRASAPEVGVDVHPLGDPMHLEGSTRAPKFSELPDPAPETVLVDETWVDAARSMTALYREKGYLSARVRFEGAVITPAGANARFVIEEGTQALVKSVAVRGAPEGLVESRQLGLKTGEPFSEKALDRARQKVSKELVKRGFLFAAIDGSYTVDSTGTRADVALVVTPGLQVKVGQVVLKGLGRTVDKVVLDQLAFTRGEPLDPETLVTSQRNLIALGIFRAADVRLLEPDDQEPVKDIVVEVRERPRLSGEFGLGYFLAEGPRLVVDAEYPNVAGRAINLSGRFRLHFFAASAPALSRQIDVSDLNGLEVFGGRGNLSAVNRGLLPLDIGLRLDLVGERVFRQSYRFTRIAAVPGLDYSKSFTIPGIEFTKPKLTLQLQAETEFTRVFSVNNASGQVAPLLRADQERLRFLFGTFALQTFRFAPTLDLRDDSVVPRLGVLVQGSAETTLSLYTRDESDQPVPVQFLKVSGTVTGYVPITRRVVFALSLRGGRIVPLQVGSVTPPVKRFFLGGSSSMRGFREDGLIAEDQRQEYARQVRECSALASQLGCTAAARSLLAGRELASQGGELFGLGKAELRFPVIGAVDVGIFFEAGNLWLAVPTNGIVLRTVAGSGLRYVTPVGPLALDFGVNLAPDPRINESAFNVHFNIGLF